MDKRFVDKILNAKKGEITENELVLSFRLAINNPRTYEDFKLVVKLAKKVESLLAPVEEKKPKSKKK